MIPLFIDCKNRHVVIFGGGNVGARKAAFFGEQAEVTVYSRNFASEFENLPVKCVRADISEYSDSEIRLITENAFLVIAATSGEELNNRIRKICMQENIPINVAAGLSGDVIIPSVIRGAHHTIAISTTGASPAVSRFVREHLEQEFPYFDEMIELQVKLREVLKQEVPDQQIRKKILWQVLKDPDIWNALSCEKEIAWNIVIQRYLA